MLDAEYLRTYDGPALRIMEVCGTHTAAIFKNGIRDFLSPRLRLVSGPGCPVCVTETAYIDECDRLATEPGCALVCFGDLMKVPGTQRTLSDVAASGGRVQMTYSPFDALELARREPETIFAVAAIGFETTAPAYALLLEEAKAQDIKNLKLLLSLKSALSAIDWICACGETVDAFLCPGHVSVITGADAYTPLAQKYGKPFVVAGFEGMRLLGAVRAAVSDAAAGRSGVRNLYPEAVSEAGNEKAKALMDKYFEPCGAVWRGLGFVENSGYRLKEAFRGYELAPDAAYGKASLEAGREKASCAAAGAGLPEGCRCGDVILGRIDPPDCPLFAKVCTPARAAGPCMVSSEGACGFWYRSREGVRSTPPAGGG